MLGSRKEQAVLITCVFLKAACDSLSVTLRHSGISNSANVTLASLSNREAVVRIVGGSIIQEILAATQAAFADAMPLESVRS